MVPASVDVEADGPLSSLASIRKSPEQNFGRCLRKWGYFLVGQSSGTVAPARCKAAFCPWCGPLNAVEVAGAIGLADPERMVRFSLVGRSWQDAQWRIEEVVRDVRAEGYGFEYCAHIEPNPRETGRHAHLWQKGSYVPQAFLQERCLAHGMGYPDIRRFRRKGGPKVSYGVKLAGIDYGLKLAERKDALEVYLEHNGGRLCHHSRGFFRDELGEVCGLTEGRAAWRRLVTEEPEDWALVCRPEWESGVRG